MKVFALHNFDEAIRKGSSAGGVFTLLAEQVIAIGGAVYGVGFDSQWNVTHLRVDNACDLSKIRGSKYAYSSLGASIQYIQEDLNSGKKVLFSGTPCQVAAVDKVVGKNANLLLVEVVCHGAPAPIFWQNYLDAVCEKYHFSRNDIDSINFRDKSTGWKTYSFSIRLNNGRKFTQRASDNPYMRAFLRDLTLRDACFKCPFKYPNSKADITLGDFWGIEKVSPQINNNDGTTIAIARTEKGESALSSFCKDAELEFDAVAKYNPAIIHTATKPNAYQSFKNEFKQNGSFLKLLKKYVGVSVEEKIKRLIKKIIRR